MNVLIVDTETTGVDPVNDSIIEVGAILFNTEFQGSLAELSFHVGSDKPNLLGGINGLPETIRPIGPFPHNLNLALNYLAKQASCIIAHNAEFDKSFMANHPAFEDLALNYKWYCTYKHFTWPGKSHLDKTNLANIALGHGLGVSHTHRALTDCQLISRILSARQDLDRVLDLAFRPRVIVEALVSYDNRHLAKKNRFEWDEVKKVWWKEVPADETTFEGFATKVRQ